MAGRIGEPGYRGGRDGKSRANHGQQRENPSQSENAGKSTGPRTPEGKAASSRNAVTHGLTADPEGANPGDPTPEYRADWRSGCDDLRPRGVLERTLAERACRAAWRLSKCDRYEDATAHRREAGTPPRRTTWSRHERVEALDRRLVRLPEVEDEEEADRGSGAKARAKDEPPPTTTRGRWWRSWR